MNLIKKIKHFFILSIIIGTTIFFIKWFNLYLSKQINILLFLNTINFWEKIYVPTVYFTLLSIGCLLFLGIQNVSKSGWSIIIHPIMEKLSSFLPYGSIIIFIIIILNIIGYINIFHWMDFDLYNQNSIKFDEFINKKKLYLNTKFFLLRNVIYLLGYNFFYFKIKKISKKLNNLSISSIKYYRKLYSISVFFIIFFSISSIFMFWDWIMSLNPHWFSTLFSWYCLSSLLVIGISLITIISIFFYYRNLFTFFKKDHLHDLSKYLFSSSLLWSYFWFSQFLLYWYGNIPEEIIFFFKRENLFYNVHIWILIPNFFIPFITLIKYKNKINFKIVYIISFILLIGHYINIYDLIIPEIIKEKNKYFDIYDLCTLLIISGLFGYCILENLKDNKINLSGNPFFNESKKYKNPHVH